MSDDHPARETRHLRVDPVAPGPGVIAEAAATLTAGGLVALPTETVYGLGASIERIDALEAVFTAKGRPHHDPLIVHLAERAELERVAELDDRARRLSERFHPGPLSLVLPRRPNVPDLVTAGGSSVAVRVPAHAVARAVIAAAGVPVAAPSANRFGQISPTTAMHVLEELDGRIDLVLDAGPTPVGVESTVVALLDGRARLLRPGAVTVEELREEVPDLEVGEREVDGRPEAPGRLLRHYAPTTPAVLVEGDPDEVRSLLQGLAARGITAAVVAPSRFGPAEPHSLGDTGAQAATRLYAALRAADRTADVVVLVAPRAEGLGRAVSDRLWRAAEGRVLPAAEALERIARLAAG